MHSTRPVTVDSVAGASDEGFELAMRAFHKGPPGIVRRVQNVDSYPGERVAPDDPPDPEAHRPLPTSGRDERQAIAEAINAFLDARRHGR